MNKLGLLLIAVRKTHHGNLGNVSERTLEKTYLMTWAYVGHFERGFQEAGLCSGLDVFMNQGQFYVLLILSRRKKDWMRLKL